MSEDCVSVDYGAKTVSVDMGDEKADDAALTTALESTKYSLAN